MSNPRSRGNRLAKLRRAEGLTAKALAVELGFDLEDVRAWESGAKIPEAAQASLAERFGVEVDWLLGREELPSEAQRRRERSGRFSRPPGAKHRLARLRAAEGLTTERLARETSVDAADIERWEAGAEIPAEHQRALASRFGVTVDWLLGREKLDSTIIPAGGDESA